MSRTRGWARVLAITIYAVGALASYVIWRWAGGGQGESFPVYLAIIAPAMAATILAPWVAGRVQRSD